MPAVPRLTKIPRDLAVAMALLFMALLILAVRLHTRTEPLEQDECMYATVAHEMLLGKRLYAEVWDIKPPAIYWTYALGIWLWGYNVNAILSLGLASAWCMLGGVYALAHQIYGRRLPALTAAALWSILGHNLWLQANQPNVEAFINPALVWGTYFWLRARSVSAASGAVAFAALAGSCFGCATLFKQVALIVPLVLVVSELVSFRSLPTGSAWRRVITCALTGVTCWLMVGLYFWRCGTGTDFFNTVVLTGKTYANSRGDIAALHDNLQHLLVLPWELMPLLLSAMVSLTWSEVLVGVNRKFLLAFLLAAPIMVMLPGQYFHHYGQLWLGPLIVAAVGIGSVRLPASSRQIPRALVGGLLVYAFASQLPQWLYSPEKWSEEKYGNLFVGTKALGERIGKVLPGKATFFEIGTDASLYFYADHRPTSGFFQAYAYLMDTNKAIYDLRAESDLKANPPLMLVTSQLYLNFLHGWNPSWAQNSRTVTFLSHRYTVEIGKSGPFLVFTYPGSSLDNEATKARFPHTKTVMADTLEELGQN